MSEAGRPVAVVTGADRGIGAGCAQVFTREGYATVLADKDFEAAEKLAKEHWDFP
jgi:NAD(P)-dependent dehydrogenase (short-subunit alcohol dehydrogenase family)